MLRREVLRLTKRRVCKDCPPGQPRPRPAPHPGPRCATHWRAVQRARKVAVHEQRVQATYGLRPGDYDRMYRYQGGVCWICRRATGRSKRLAVDHNHITGEFRGLLCGRCNHDVIGHLREDPDALHRAIWYLLDPPARRALASADT